MDVFTDKNAAFLVDIISKKATYKNYREFMKEVLKCEKDETYFSLGIALCVIIYASVI
jgi:hypothetical protein